jgi:hypothetical protein
LPGAFAPGSGEDAVNHKHSHVAAETVALVRDAEQELDDGGSEAGLEGIDLHDVRPRREVGVFSAGEDLFSCANVGAWVVAEIVGAALDEMLGMVLNPGAIGSDVVGHEIKQEFYAAIGEFAAGDGQALWAAEMLVDDIASHAVG